MPIKEEIRFMAKKLDVFVTKNLKIYTTEDIETRELVKHCIDISQLHSYLKSLCTNKGIPVGEVEVVSTDYSNADKTLAWKYSKTYEPFDHQAAYFNLSINKFSFGNFSEMGTGKTIMELMVTGYLYDAQEIEALVIIAPNGVHRQWITEAIPEHLIDHVNPLCGIWSSKNKKSYKHFMERFIDIEHKGLKVLSMNVEALGSPSQKAYDYIYNFMEKHNCILVIDESTRIKSHKAKRTKAVLQLANLAKYKRILSGLYAPNGPLDLYSQFYFLDPHILGYKSYVSFRSRYAVEKNPRLKADLAVALESKALGEKVYNERLQRFVSPARLERLLPDDISENKLNQVWKILKKSFLFIVDYKNIEELSENIKDHSFRVLKEECLDLPEKLFQQYEIELSPEQKRLYNELEQNLIVEIGNYTYQKEESDRLLTGEGELTADHVLKKLGYLRQICGGSFRTEDEEYHIIEGKIPRLEKTVEIINDVDIDRKFIIWCCYRAEVEMMKRRLSEEFGEETFAEIHGGVTGEAREEEIRKLKEDKECRFLIGTAKAGGIGRNLTVATYMIFYSNSFELEERRQAEDRFARLGQVENVTVIDMYTKDLIDEQIFKALMNKQKISDKITQDKLFWRPLGNK